MNSGRIAVIGSYNRDIGMAVDQFPRAGETRQAEHGFQSHGGKGSNQALQAALFPVEVAMIAAVGEDANGREALALWRGRGIDVSAALSLADCATGMALVLVERGGENMIIVDAGANGRLDTEAARRAEPLLAGADLVLAQLETPWPATRQAFEIARAHQATTVLNAAPLQQALGAEQLALVDMLIVNEIEAGQLADQLGLTGTLEARAGQLLRWVRQAVVLTLGGEGAVLFQPDQPPVRIAAPKVAVVDTTGAGDAFTGAFVAQWVSTRDLSAAATWGVAAGAYACGGQGAASSYGDPAAIAERHGAALGLAAPVAAKA